MSKSNQSLEERVTVKTLIWVAILAVVLTAFWDAFTLFLPTVAFCTQNVSNLIPTPGVCLMGAPFLMLSIAMVLMRAPSIGRRLTTTNLVYLYVTALAVAYFANTTYPWGYVAGLFFSKILSSPEHIRYIPDFIAPPREVAELLWRGTGSVWAIPWSAVLPRDIWNFLIIALFGCISISIVNIFRRQWIDVEAIPFPHVMLAHAVLVNVESSVKREWPSKTMFLLGILLGFLLVMPVSMVTLFPWFPDILMWRTGTCGPGSHWIAPPDVPWHLGILKYPPMYALALLVPLHFLISVLFYIFVMEVAFFASFYMGYYTGYLQIGFCGRNWCTPAPYHDPPLYMAVVNTGCILGVFVMTLFLQRGYILETLKAAFGRSRSGEEAGEPMTWRASWIMFIVSFIAMILFFVFTGLSPWLSFAIVLSGLISWFVAAQVWGRAGVYWDSPCYNFTPGFVRLLVYPTVQWPQITSTELAIGPVITTMWGGHQSIAGWGGSFYTALGSYRMAKLTGVSSKNVMKVMVTALFTSMLVTHLVDMGLLGVVGASKFVFPTIKATAIDVDRWGNFWSKPTGRPMTDVIPWVAVGFIFMVVMKYLYSRILWLPDPLAAIPAWSWTVSLHGVWFPFLVAYVIKSIVLKVGGSKLYEEKVVPLVGGFIVGSAVEILITAITSYALFPRF
jgi:hypothetical protein